MTNKPKLSPESSDEDLNRAVAEELGTDTIPNYCEEISAAWEIVEQLRAEKKHLVLFIAFDGFALAIPTDLGKMAVSAKTASRSIVLAFLKLRGRM